MDYIAKKRICLECFECVYLMLFKWLKGVGGRSFICDNCIGILEHEEGKYKQLKLKINGKFNS